MCAMAKTWVNCLYRGILRNPFSTRVTVYPLWIRTAHIMMTTRGLIHPMVILPLLMNNSHFPDYNPYSWWLYNISLILPPFIAFNGGTSVKKKQLFLHVFSSLNDGYVSQTILKPHFSMVFQVFRGEKSHFPRRFLTLFTATGGLQERPGRQPGQPGAASPARCAQRFFGGRTATLGDPERGGRWAVVFTAMWVKQQTKPFLDG